MNDIPSPTYQPQPAERWTVTSSRRLVDDRWLKLRADDCVTMEGVQIAPYYVLEYPDWVHVVALDCDDQLLLVEQYRHGLGVTSLELPGGVIEPDDRSPLIAAARELEEETGFGADLWRHVARLAPNPANQNNYCHVVLATDARPHRAPTDDPTERIRTLRLPVAEAVRLALSGEIIQATHVASMVLALNSIGRWER